MAELAMRTLVVLCFTAACSSSAAPPGADLSASNDLAVADAAGAPATQLAFTLAPTAGTAGVVLGPVEVTIEDAAGARVGTSTMPVTLSLAGGDGGVGATLSGTVTVAADRGVARFTTLAIDRAGTFELVAAAGSLVTATSSPIVVVPAAGWYPSSGGVVGGTIDALAMAGSTLYAAPDTGGLFRLAGGRFTALAAAGIPAGAAIFTLWVDPSDAMAIYGSTGSSLFRSTDGGATFRDITPPSTPRDLAFDRLARVVYVATGGGVYKSATAAINWTALTSPANESGLVIDPTTTGATARLYLGSLTGLSQSLDGMTFSGANFTTGVNGVALDPTAPAKVYLTDGNNVFATANAGSGAATTWTPAVTAPGSSAQGLFQVVVDPATPSTLYASELSFSVALGGLFRSTNSGVGFRQVNELALGLTPQAVVFAGATVYVATDGALILRSIDGGATFSRYAPGLERPAPSHSVAVSPAGAHALYLATQGVGIQRSTDGGLSYTELAGPGSLGHPQVVALSPTSALDLAAADSSSGPAISRLVVRSTDGGATWTRSQPGSASSVVNDLAFEPGGTVLYAATTDGVFYSTDGTTWPVPTRQVPRPALAVRADPRTANVVYAGVGAIIGTGQNGVYKSLDAGRTWTQSATGIPDPCDISTLALDGSTSPATVWANCSLVAPAVGGVYRSLDGGTTWTLVLTKANVSSLLVSGSALYVGTSSGPDGVLVSADGGATFTAVRTGLTDLSVFSLAADPTAASTLFAATTSGLFKTTNGGR